jgi:hypothetical protein
MSSFQAESTASTKITFTPSLNKARRRIIHGQKEKQVEIKRIKEYRIINAFD